MGREGGGVGRENTWHGGGGGEFIVGGKGEVTRLPVQSMIRSRLPISLKS